MQDTVWGLKQPHCNWLDLTVPPQRTAENELDQVIRKCGILNVHYLRHLLQEPAPGSRGLLLNGVGKLPVMVKRHCSPEVFGRLETVKAQTDHAGCLLVQVGPIQATKVWKHRLWLFVPIDVWDQAALEFLERLP